MDDFAQLFHEALARAIAAGEIEEKDIAEASAEALEAFVPDTARAIVRGLKRAAPQTLREQMKADAGFVKRNYRRWKKPLDLLEMLWTVCEEVGGKFNQTERPAAIVAKDYQFEALVSLHARALLVVREVLCLLHGGFPDGALSRWRSLHELSVTAGFLQKHDQESAHRYLASFACASFRAATQLNVHAERAGMTPFSTIEIEQMKQQCEAVVGRFGSEMRQDYGWASRALNNPRPNFSDLEKAVGLDHWRPRYRWASQHTHGGYRPPLALLGAVEVVEPLHLVGQSNSGFTDPIHMTALALIQVTSTLLVTRPTIDTIIFITVASNLGADIGEAALAVDKAQPKENRKGGTGKKRGAVERRTRLAKKRTRKVVKR